VVALDCEMVGCGIDGSRSLLARASIVSYHGHILYDTFVQPPDLVSDYRTHVSGIRPGDLDPPRAIPFHQAQREVQDLIQGRVVVAHSVVADLQALGLSHPSHLLRDTAHFPLLCPERARSLRSLVVERLGWSDFQCGEHDSVDDARAVMGLYRLVEEEWEAVMRDERALEEREKKALAAKSAATARQRALMIQQQQQQQQPRGSIGYSGYQQQAHSGVYGSGVSAHHSSRGGYGNSVSCDFVGQGGGVGGGGGHQFGVTGAAPSLHLNQLHPSQSSIHSSLWK
jgi:RNA exonuclease 4